MKIEIYCDVHSVKICDIEHDKNSPVYVPPCEKCLRGGRQQGIEEVCEVLKNMGVKA